MTEVRHHHRDHKNPSQSTFGGLLGMRTTNSLGLGFGSSHTRGYHSRIVRDLWKRCGARPWQLVLSAAISGISMSSRRETPP